MKGEALKLFRGARKGRSIVEEEETQQTFFFHSQLFFLFLASSALLERARKREREREPHGSSTAKLSRDVLLPAALPKTMDGGSSSSAGGDVRLFFFSFFSRNGRTHSLALLLVASPSLSHMQLSPSSHLF